MHQGVSGSLFSFPFPSTVPTGAVPFRTVPRTGMAARQYLATLPLAAAITRQPLEVLRLTNFSVQPVVDAPQLQRPPHAAVSLHKVKYGAPHGPTIAPATALGGGAPQGGDAAEYDHAMSGAAEHNVDSIALRHESDVAVSVVAHRAQEHHRRLLALMGRTDGASYLYLYLHDQLCYTKLAHVPRLDIHRAVNQGLIWHVEITGCSSLFAFCSLMHLIERSEIHTR